MGGNNWGPVLQSAVAVIDVSWFGIRLLSTLPLSCHPKKNLPPIVKHGVILFPSQNRNVLASHL